MAECRYSAVSAVTLSILVQGLVRKYLRYGLHEGICVTVDSFGRVNAAPMGVEIMDRGSDVNVIMRVYPETRTSLNLRQVPEFTMNFTYDPVLFFDSIFRKESLTLLPSRHVHPPRLDGAVDLVLECKVIARLRDVKGRDLIIGSVNDAYSCEGSKMAYSRGVSAFMEALVYLTKLAALAASISHEEKVKYLRRINDECLLTMRIGNEKLRQMCSTVLELARNYLSRHAPITEVRWEGG